MNDIHMAMIIISVFIIIGLYLIVKGFVKGDFSLKKRRALAEQKLNAEPEIVTIHAEVIDIACKVTSVGIRIPKVIKYFVVKFKKDDGDILIIDVGEEYYDGFEIGLVGNLTLVDGKLNSFVPDEF